MQSKFKNKILPILCLVAMGFLILNSRKAVVGAKEGIELCIYTVVPALLPYCVLSLLLQSMIFGKRLWILTPIERLCAMPKGAGIIFLLGILGGYPTGAICTEHAAVNKKDAQRMICFCNNAGPSFIFGIVSALFKSTKALFMIWVIQIMSAIITGFILRPAQAGYEIQNDPIKHKKIVNEAIRSMVNVCCTIILFKVMICCAESLLFSKLDQSIRIILIGFLELTNGITMLGQIENIPLKFIISNGFLAFGGICVALQTFSITKKANIALYFAGKLLQCLIAMLLSCMICYSKINLIAAPVLLFGIFAVNKLKKKKTIAFSV